MGRGSTSQENEGEGGALHRRMKGRGSIVQEDDGEEGALVRRMMRRSEH